MPLLTARIKESLRHIPSGVSITHVVPPTGAVICGQQIPGGTTVGMPILHVHQPEDIFEDALQFDPDRWQQEDAKDLEQWIVPFSRGLRMCFGVNLAWCELPIAFATLIRRFDMALDGTTAEDMEWEEYIAAHYPRRQLCTLGVGQRKRNARYKLLYSLSRTHPYKPEIETYTTFEKHAFENLKA